MPPKRRLVEASACWKASKMILLLAGMPMPVSVTSKATTAGDEESTGWPASSPPGRRHPQAHAAALGELEGVREQVLEHLLQTLGVGHQGAAERRVEIDVERQLAALRLVAEHAAERLGEVAEEDLLGLDGDRPALDLGQVENVGDQVQQVGAGAVDRARELDLLGAEVPFGFSASCWPRIRMLFSGVRSSCDMLARNSDLYLEVSASSAGLLLERPAGVLDLLVLALDFDVLLGELPWP